MRRITLLTVITLTLAMALYAQSRTPQSKSAASKSSSATNQRAKVKGRALVKQLPAGVGAVIKNGVVRLKPGYKFVKEPGGKVSVYLDNDPLGGSSLSGTFTCNCVKATNEGGSSCSLQTSTSYAYCTKSDKDPCNGECRLNLTISGSTQSVIAY